MNEIPVSGPSLTDLEADYVLDAVRSGWISGTGPYVERFEAEWAARCGAARAVSVSSGTAALILLLLALGAGPGDEVVLPALTYAAVANAVRHVGGTPIVVDVEPSTWCLDAEAAAAAVTRRTVGVVAVHAYGHPADVGAIRAVARRHGIWVVEDGAEAHLAAVGGRPVGGLADGAAFSFYGNKIVTTGEGGAITVNDPDLADTLRALRHQGVRLGRDDRYRPSLVGHSVRMSNVAAAIGCAQLARVDALLARRRVHDRTYRGVLQSVAGVGPQPAAAWATPVPWLHSVTIDGRPGQRDAVIAALGSAQVEARPLFPPLGSLPVAQPLRAPCPVADHLAEVGLSLPLHPDLRTADVLRVATLAAEVVAGELPSDGLVLDGSDASGAATSLARRIGRRRLATDGQRS